MAKGIGLIGNFKGKVGNTVGYKLTASNNGQTQGIRVYQPIVKNPKSAGQAEQRAKLLAVNATYRSLKMVIDRGNEGLPYGNKSRLAWLKTALTAQQMPWIEKGSVVSAPVVCQLTKGSLPGVSFSATSDNIKVDVLGVTSATTMTTIGQLTTALMAAYPNLKKGDQLTFVFMPFEAKGLQSEVVSIVLDSKSADTLSSHFGAVTAIDDAITFEGHIGADFGAVIVSRLGDNGEHLRSNTTLAIEAGMVESAPYDEISKDEAIASYRASAASNSDWAEESIQ